MAEFMASERFEIKRLGSLMAWTSFLSFDLIVLGALVRSTDSGLACPDWPLCYGQLIPTMNMQIFLEWFHRFSALILGLFLIKIIYTVFKSSIIKEVFGKQIIAAGLLFLSQCILGGLTVLKLLDPNIVSLHLINAVLFFSLLIWVTVKSKIIVKLAEGKTSSFKVPKSISWFLFGFIIVVLSQILLGGLVSTSHAGVICPDFPKCYGQWFPPSSFLVNLQVFHRFLAYGIFLLAVIYSLMTFRLTLPPVSQIGKKALPAFILLQIVLGAINVIYVLPHWATVSHLANAMIIFTLLLTSYIEIILLSTDFPKQYSLNSISNKNTIGTKVTT